MCTISINSLLIDNDYPTAGSILYDQIIANYDCEDHFNLDLKDVEMLPSMFLNTSLGKLINEKGKTSLKKIRFINLTKTQADRIKDYVNKIS